MSSKQDRPAPAGSLPARVKQSQFSERSGSSDFILRTSNCRRTALRRDAPNKANSMGEGWLSAVWSLGYDRIERMTRRKNKAKRRDLAGQTCGDLSCETKPISGVPPANAGRAYVRNKPNFGAASIGRRGPAALNKANLPDGGSGAGGEGSCETNFRAPQPAAEDPPCQTKPIRTDDGWLSRLELGLRENRADDASAKQSQAPRSCRSWDKDPSCETKPFPTCCRLRLDEPVVQDKANSPGGTFVTGGSADESEPRPKESTGLG